MAVNILLVDKKLKKKRMYMKNKNISHNLRNRIRILIVD